MTVTLRVDGSGTIVSQEGSEFGELAGQRLSAVLRGPLHAAEVNGRPVSVQFEDRDGLVVRLENDTERRKQLETLLTSEEQLREAQEIGGIGSWHWDVPQNQTTWSAELYHIFGQDPEKFEATYEGWLGCVVPEDVELTQEATGHTFQTGEPFRFEHRVQRPDGSIRLLHCQGAAIMGDDGPLRMYGTSQDVTEQREAQAAAQKAQEQDAEIERLTAAESARQEAISVLAHELKTPLTPISLQLQLLDMGKLGTLDEPAQNAVKTISKNIGRLAQMTGEMLDVARMSQGPLELHKETVDMGDMVAEVASEFSSQAEAEDKRLEVRADHVASQVDGNRMHQVLTNLVSNALKFSPPGERIALEVTEQDDHVVLRTRDHGLGMAPEQLAGLFKPFARMHPEAGQPGTGLGLHVCKGIVESHGGQLTCQSDGPGTGCTFEVKLPKHAAAVAPMSPS